MHGKKLMVWLLFGTFILDIVFLLRDLSKARIISDGVWIYPIGIVPFGFLLITVRNKRLERAGSLAGLIYAVLYAAVALNVNFFSTSGVDVIALVTLPIFATDHTSGHCVVLPARIRAREIVDARRIPTRQELTRRTSLVKTIENYQPEPEL